MSSIFHYTHRSFHCRVQPTNTTVTTTTTNNVKASLTGKTLLSLLLFVLFFSRPLLKRTWYITSLLIIIIIIIMMLPHSVPRSGNHKLPPYNGAKSSHSKPGGNNRLSPIRRCSTLLCIFCIATVPSFFFGMIFTHITHMSTDALITKLLKRDLTHDEITTLCQDHTERILDHHNEQQLLQQQASTDHLLPLQSVGRYAAAISRVSKQEFTNTYDFGVPLDPPSPGAEDVLVLYSNEKAMPTNFGTDRNTIPELTMSNAVENCDYMNVVLTDHGRRRQCIAIVPQYESFHIQKWMRIDTTSGHHGKLDSSYPLQMVSRGYTDKGRDNFAPPYMEHTKQHWSMLQRYFDTVNDVLAELKPKLESIAIKNTVIVMVCNFGQVELLMNFVCSTQKNNIDTSNIIVFTTDPETTDIVEALGLTAFYDERNFGDVPTEAARRYGDARFVAMMMAKVICVQLVSLLGYDFLFQDVDIVWYKHPLEYFHNPNMPAYNYDAFFQDDGGHSVRYAPYSANSGFYFIRHNNRTRYFLTSILMAGDLILKTDSHQQALIATLNEHVSLYGLKAKVLSRDMEEFPGGYQFHQHSKKYMKDFYSGLVKPYMFHMSWTLNKNNKLLFLRQMGEWYVQDQCIDKKIVDIQSLADNTERNGENNIIHTCCSAEPIFSCHYRDKPSMKPCKSSPPIDKGRPSWW